jgi:hypothetical protein
MDLERRNRQQIELLNLDIPNDPNRSFEENERLIAEKRGQSPAPLRTLKRLSQLLKEGPQR